MPHAADSPTVGRYRLGARIGGGRLARIYRAEGPSGPVALKLLAPDAELDDPSAAARFGHEVAALSAVSHANVIPLIDHGVDPELGPYLVTPLVAGRTLREQIAAGRVEPSVAAAAVREIAAGLAAVHAAGLVHRDLKPENVMVRADGSVVILDLGLAWSHTQTRYTEEGAVAGSVPYMAPEQIDGDTPVPATDLWALAVIAHEWIAGSRPFARERQSEEVAAILSAGFTPLVDRDPRVSAALGRLIDGCLARDPAARPSGGEALYRALGPHVAGDASALLRDPRAASDAESRTRAAAALDEARRLLRRGDTFAAARAVERAAAHRPDDPQVLAVAAEVGRTPARRRRVWPWLLATGAAVAAIAAAAVLIFGSGSSAPPAATDGAAALDPATLPDDAPPDEDALAAMKKDHGQLLIEEYDGNPYDLAISKKWSEIEASNDPALFGRYARAMAAVAKRDEALAAARAATDRFPDDAGAWLVRADLTARTGDVDTYATYLDRALALRPDDAGGLRDRGRVRRARGQLASAYADLERSRSLAPDDPTTLHELVAIYLHAGHAEAARPLAVHETEVAPASADAWIDRAVTTGGADALPLLERAVRLDPRSARAFHHLCLIGAPLDNPGATDDCFQAGVLGDHAPELTLAAVDVFVRHGDLMRARTQLEVFGGKDVRISVREAEIDEQTGANYEAHQARVEACALGDADSCAKIGAPAPSSAAGAGTSH